MVVIIGVLQLLPLLLLLIIMIITVIIMMLIMNGRARAHGALRLPRPAITKAQSGKMGNI